LADKVTVQLKHDLGIPSHHIEEVEDLPIAEILTNSLTGFEQYTLGLNSLMFKNDYYKAIDYFNKALSIDQGFVLAKVQLANAYFFTNQSDKCEKTLQSILQHQYKLSNVSS